MKKIWLPAGLVLLILAAAAGGYFFGRYSVRTENFQNGMTFYAEIKNIEGDTFLVQGLSVNDINSRGRFHFKTSQRTQLLWRSEKIALTELKAGDRIAVTYTGMVEETEPAGIKEVIRIQLLSDR